MLKLLCIFLSVATLSYAQICPSGWSPFNSKCLIVKTEKKAWFTAEEYCNQAAPKGHLTSISSAFENAKISALAQASGTSASQLWIGGTDLIQNGSYSWFDGQPLLYANWEQGQPDSSKHCVSSQAAGTGKWRTEVCNVQNGYICEAPMQVFMGASSWNDANSKCLGNGGNLTSVHSDVENNFIG
uniref:C-type lectin domain-containing protein n=1 Tax=Plectus sambesii TaxID=2011161 RepID=A0A914URT5_9BILA